MLQLPVYDQFGDVTVYQDSDKDYVFYAMPAKPTLRYGQDGRPIFMFLKYREAADRLTEAGERGGGYVQFDVEFRVPEAQLKTIRETLQGRVNKIYRERNQRPPDVQLAPPTFVDGTVELITMQVKEGGMIEHIAGAGKPSLIGSNVAAFAMELSERGAALLWEGFQMATLPVAVRYNLVFLARVPALQMHIWLNSTQLHSYWEQITREIDESVWGDTEENFTRTTREYFVKNQIAKVDIVDWPAEFAGGADGEKFKKEMIEWGWGLLEDSFRDALGDKFSAATDTGGVGDFRNVTREYVERHVSTINVFFERNSVIKWPLPSVASIQGFLNVPGPNGQRPRKEDLFKEVSLDDPFFRLLQITGRCNADFKNDPIYAVKLHIEYGDRDEDYIFQDNTTSATFREFIKPELGRKYQYWTEISYKNRERKFRSSTTTTDETQLILNFGALGYLKVEVIAGDFDWTVIDHAQVHIRYSDAANDVPMEENVLKLSEAQTSATYQRVIWAPVARPYEYKVIYFLQDGQQVEREWVAASQTPLMINDIFEDRLIVRLVPTGSFEHMNRIIVDMEYQDQRHDYTMRETFSISDDQTEPVWSVRLWDEAPQEFRYRTIVTFRDGPAKTGEWQTGKGSMTLLVGEQEVKPLKVELLTDLLDFSVVRLAKIDLRYLDPANRIDESDSFVFTADKPDSQTWELPIKDPAQRTYSYKAMFVLHSGGRKTIAETNSSEEVLLVELPS